MLLSTLTTLTTDRHGQFTINGLCELSKHLASHIL